MFAPDDIALDDFLRGEYNPQATVALTHTFLDQEDLHDAEDVAEGFVRHQRLSIMPSD